MTNSGSVPCVYLDTSVICGAVKGDMSPADEASFMQLTDMVSDSRLTFCASTVARKEIDKIPTAYRQEHLKMYQSLRILRGSNATWMDDDPGLTAFGDVIQHQDYETLRSILRDENDARHVFQAKMGGVSDIVTADYHSILNKSDQLTSKAGMNAYSPSQYLSQLST